MNATTYRPARHGTADAKTKRTALLRLAQQEAADGFIFSVCMVCHPPIETSALLRVGNVSHGYCKPCFDAAMKAIR